MPADLRTCRTLIALGPFGYPSKVLYQRRLSYVAFAIEVDRKGYKCPCEPPHIEMPPASTSTLCLTFHTERIHEDNVWVRVVRLLDRFDRLDWKATFFISPALAILARADLEARLKEIRSRGHELGQHTHYYDVSQGELEKAPVWPSSQRIIEALERDYDYLRTADVTPVGFASGGHAIFDETLDWLVEKGFKYDCSFRAFPLEYAAPSAQRGFPLMSPSRHKRVLLIPTTGNLKRALWRESLRRRRTVRFGERAYEMYYVHDWDLLRVGPMVAMKLLPFLASVPSVHVGDLAQMIESAGLP